MEMKRAFTLIELLVVIAIIALLMALGLTVAKSAREYAAGSVCSSNLRQMTMSLQAYCADNDGGFPDPSYLYHSGMSLDANIPVVYPMGCRWHDARIGPASSLLRENKALQGALTPYLGDPKILLCKTGARANRDRGCCNMSPVVTEAHWTETERGHSGGAAGTGMPHQENIAVVPQYTYTMNGNLYRTLKTASLAAGSQTRLNPKTFRLRDVRKETHVARSPSEVFAFGEENSWAVNTRGFQPNGAPCWVASCDLSGRWAGSMDHSDPTDFFMTVHEFAGTITLGGLDIAPSYVFNDTGNGIYASKVSDTAAGDAFATYHRGIHGDLNTGRSYVSMLDGHVREVTVADQLRRSREDPNLPPSRLGPGGNLYLAWPLDVPPLGGWENQ